VIIGVIAIRAQGSRFGKWGLGSPPTETLGSNAKALKADWKGQMLDLSNDPDRNIPRFGKWGLGGFKVVKHLLLGCGFRGAFDPGSLHPRLSSPHLPNREPWARIAMTPIITHSRIIRPRQKR
jgi:hypothetical protein